MHYCLILFTSDFPTKEKIEEIMSPYDEGNAQYDDVTETRIGEPPMFEWDWYQIGGRYSGQLKLKVDEANETYDWRYVAKQPRNGRLFWSYLLTKIEERYKNTRDYFMYSEENYFTSMGYRDGYLYVDGAKASDVLNLEDLGCYTFIGSDGNAYTRQHWNGKELIENKDFDERFKSELDKSKDMYVTVIDYHD